MKHLIVVACLIFSACGPTCEVLAIGEPINKYVQTPPGECPLNACADAHYACSADAPVQCVVVPALADAAGHTCYAMVRDAVIVARFTR